MILTILSGLDKLHISKSNRLGRIRWPSKSKVAMYTLNAGLLTEAKAELGGATLLLNN